MINLNKTFTVASGLLLSVALTLPTDSFAHQASVFIVPNKVHVSVGKPMYHSSDYNERMHMAHKIKTATRIGELPRVHHSGPNMKVTFKHRHNAQRFISTISHHPFQLYSTSNPGYLKHVQIDQYGYNAVYLTKGQYRHLSNILNHRVMPVRNVGYVNVSIR